MIANATGAAETSTPTGTSEAAMERFLYALGIAASIASDIFAAAWMSTH